MTVCLYEILKELVKIVYFFKRGEKLHIKLHRLLFQTAESLEGLWVWLSAVVSGAVAWYIPGPGIMPNTMKKEKHEINRN